MDYLNEDLSVRPGARGFSQSGLFTTCIIGGSVEIGCIQQKILKSSTVRFMNPDFFVGMNIF